MKIKTDTWHYKWYVFISTLWLHQFNDDHKFMSGRRNRGQYGELIGRTTEKTTACLYWRTVYIWPIVIVLNMIVFAICFPIAVVGGVFMVVCLVIGFASECWDVLSWCWVMFGALPLMKIILVVLGIVILTNIMPYIIAGIVWPFKALAKLVRWIKTIICPTYEFEVK